MSLFNFGQATPAPQPGQQQSSGFSFTPGQPAGSQPSLFGQPAASQPSLFESPFGQTGFNSFQQPTSSAFGQTGFNSFQQPASSGNLNQPLSLTSAPQPLSLSSAPQPLSLSSAPAPQPVVTVSTGLGGEGASNQAAAADSKLPKDSQILPPEISSLVDSLKNFIAVQKSLSEKNSLPKYSVQPILDIGSELDEEIKTALQRLDVTLERNKTAVESLKKETNLMVSDAETAFRSIKSLGISATSSSYPFLQSPASPSRTSVYFDRLVDQFQHQMDIYSRQIKELEVHLANMNKPYLPHEVILIVKKQHEILVALASEIYALHQDISSLDTKRSGGLSSLDTKRSSGLPSSGKSLKGTNKSLVGPNPFALTSSSTPHNPENLSSVPASSSSSSSLFQTNPLTNFSFSSSNTSSSNRAKRFTAS